jgi:hypothetical protein
MQENMQKVIDKVNQLNRAEKVAANRKWSALDGYNALTTVTFDANNRPIYNPSFGYPIKVFINNATGEMKLFSVYKFTGQ